MDRDFAQRQIYAFLVSELEFRDTSDCRIREVSESLTTHLIGNWSMAQGAVKKRIRDVKATIKRPALRSVENSQGWQMEASTMTTPPGNMLPLEGLTDNEKDILMVLMYCICQTAEPQRTSLVNMTGNLVTGWLEALREGGFPRA